LRRPRDIRLIIEAQRLSANVTADGLPSRENPPLAITVFALHADACNQHRLKKLFLPREAAAFEQLPGSLFFGNDFV